MVRAGKEYPWCLKVRVFLIKFFFHISTSGTSKDVQVFNGRDHIECFRKPSELSERKKKLEGNWTTWIWLQPKVSHNTFDNPTLHILSKFLNHMGPSRPLSLSNHGTKYKLSFTPPSQVVFYLPLRLSITSIAWKKSHRSLHVTSASSQFLNRLFTSNHVYICVMKIPPARVFGTRRVCTSTAAPGSIHAIHGYVL